MDNDEMDRLYMEALREELSIYTVPTDKVREPIYTGEYGFTLFVQCIKIDVPPPNHPMTPLKRYFQFKMQHLEHDMLMLILTHLRDYITEDICKEFIHHSFYGSKKSKVSTELESLGISYMGKWITCARDGTYKIHIRSIPYTLCSKISKILFSW